MDGEKPMHCGSKLSGDGNTKTGAFFVFGLCRSGSYAS